MESLYLLIPLSLVLAFVIGFIFWMATRTGQFDDLEGPGHRILMDDDRPTPSDKDDLNADPPPR
ncbi:cytochrome oxidase maturation protein, cbb3-type [Pseudogulbenkiania sp. NH8B]|uniref:Cytochrome oxidase maturation protein, cbb3-type n=1 Tax=Pseudogulbenkiania ferrooxidans 2002 TaxID=279714 RepID=B9Z0X5_9NEIS|nr:MULTISPECIES: cbb3-type cytochrome oxidase assembly protein CcoS [Pseudogulbenkiania]EEG09731.1 cytochrome oxidase maturation protein, cbb3-type [Pseudogulbenkiania ferrooxidans 2002]BAK77100.1 cytochrome oxidase maturation protein, cbb3-type [Pseudogulbenkiania sp. NH8B]